MERGRQHSSVRAWGLSPGTGGPVGDTATLRSRGPACEGTEPGPWEGQSLEPSTQSAAQASSPTSPPWTSPTAWAVSSFANRRLDRSVPPQAPLPTGGH